VLLLGKVWRHRFFFAVQLRPAIETPERHGQAWGAAQWVGDLRTPDGKIVLIRENVSISVCHTFRLFI
jgi:hypothetical protein